MESHRSSPGEEPRSPAGSGRRRRRGRDREPLDAAWLEGHALRYAARWETSAHGVAALLERKIRERCDRTGEAPEEALDWIPDVVDRLVARRYVDDQRFASQLFERLQRQGRSAARIRLELQRKGVPEAITRELLREREETDPEAELQAARQVARRRRLGPYGSGRGKGHRCADGDAGGDGARDGDGDGHDAGQRAAEHHRQLAVLARQGFSLEIAQRVLDARSEAQLEPEPEES